MLTRFVLFSIVLFSLSCETVSDELSFDRVPKIRIIEASHNSLVQFQDSPVLKIEYEDGDGDLGTSDPDVNSILVQDSRLENPDEYYLPPLAPEGAEVSITGTFNLVLLPTFLLGNGTEEKVIFSIKLFDRAGNVSNEVETEEITVVK